jgi:hypothetical protein
MTSGTATARVIAALVCDDVRKEDNGKEILIGVYTGGIVVPAMPAALILSLWLFLEPKGSGELPIEMQLLNDEGTQLIHARALGVVQDTNAELTAALADADDDRSSLAFARFPVKFEKEGRLRFQVKVGNDDWQTVAEKRVIDSRHLNQARDNAIAKS